MGDEAGRVLSEKWKSMKSSANTVWEALPFTSDTATTSSARGRLGDGLVGTLQGLTTLMGPPEEMTQAAYFSGNPDAIAAVEAAQGAQQQAVGAIIDHVKQSWTEASARNGTAGASAMLLTSLGTEIAGSKGLGTLGNVAGKIAEIARLAKTPLEAASLLDKEISAAKLAKKSADEIKLLEKARDERLAQAAKEAKAVEKPGEGVHVKKAPISKNGYTYHFDEKGRVSKMEGDVTINKAQGRNQKAQLEAGGTDRLANDQGGHYAGRRFDGPTDDFNHFAQNGNFNQSAYKKLENSWETALNDGKSIRIEITPSYVGDSLRPNTLTVKQWVDGVPNDPIVFNNRHGG